VNTPYLAAVVKGTTFSVTVTPAGASVQVTEGLVQVASLDGLASRFVSPGEIGMISASAPGQLSVLGTPGAPKGGAAVIGVAPETPTHDAETVGEPAAAPVSEVAEVRIASPIGEGNVNLAAQTGGIVSGNSSLAQAAILEAVTVATPVAAEVPASTEVTIAALETPVPVTEAPLAEPTPPVEQVSPPAEVPVEVAVALPPEPLPPSVVEAESPTVPATPEAEAPVLVAVNNAPAPIESSPNAVPSPAELAVNTDNPAPVIAIDSLDEDDAPSSANGNGSSGNGKGNSSSGGNSNSGKSNGGSSSNSGSSNSGSNSKGGGTAVASNASGKGNGANPTTLSELLQRLQVAAQQLAANRKGN
jgi:hypothetical protein